VWYAISLVTVTFYDGSLGPIRRPDAVRREFRRCNGICLYKKEKEAPN
jgi:hypothetical protein